MSDFDDYKNPDNEYHSSRFQSSQLFGDERLYELTGETYYAVIDSIEQINNVSYVRFDCLNAKNANSITIDKDSILRFPSIVIDIQGNSSEIQRTISNGRVKLVEGRWVLLKTKLRRTQSDVRQYFNLNRVAPEVAIGTYDIESITFYNDLSSAEKAKIREIIAALAISPSSEKDVQNFLNQISYNPFERVNVYNVGQGNCIGLTNRNNVPHVYFDVGNGCNRNAHTFKQNFKLCVSLQPHIILSHWDQDHFQTAMYDPRTWECKWLAPHQELTNTAYRLANMLISKNNLIIWPSSISHLDFGGNRIVKCTSNRKFKNSSGLALFINQHGNNYIMLPGDATFNKIENHPVSANIIGLVASHHGSQYATRGMPTASPPSLLAYSYGLNNREGHVHMSARNSYTNNGWHDVRETVNGNITMAQQQISLDVPCSGLGCYLQIATGQHY